MFTNECKTIHNFVTISFYNDIVVKGRPQLSFLPPILLNQIRFPPNLVEMGVYRCVMYISVCANAYIHCLYMLKEYIYKSFKGRNTLKSCENR